MNLYYIIQRIEHYNNIGDWGLGIGDWGLGPIPNPQSPIPNPQYLYNKYNLHKYVIIYIYYYICNKLII